MASTALSNSSDTDTHMNSSLQYPLLNSHPLTHSSMPMHMYPITPSSQRTLRTKRRQVKNACTNCQRACKRCDVARPCLRCVKYGLQLECVDSQRKERKKGIKRGPYKKRDCKGRTGNKDVEQFAETAQQYHEMLPITDGEGPDNPAAAASSALSPYYMADPAYQHLYPSMPPQTSVKMSEPRALALPPLSPPSQRHYHSQIYNPYSHPPPPPLPPTNHTLAGSNTHYPSPPASHYQASEALSDSTYLSSYPSYSTYSAYVPHQQQPLMVPPVQLHPSLVEYGRMDNGNSTVGCGEK